MSEAGRTRLPSSVGVSEQGVVTVDHPAAAAAIHLHGGNVTSWTPSGDQDRLWLSPLADVDPGAATRGGVPVCFPWFSLGPGDLQPQHGFARRATWRLGEVTEDADGVTVRLHLDDTAVTDVDGRERWPHPFALELTVGVGAELSLELAMINTGERAVHAGAALHTYLAVDALGVSLDGLDGIGFHDKVGGTDQTQSGALTLTAETDRIYDTIGPVTLDDGRRRTEVAQVGGTRTVVWNPWVDKSQAIGDLPDDGYRSFVCVEAAIPYGTEPEISPGRRHVLRQVISPRA